MIGIKKIKLLEYLIKLINDYVLNKKIFCELSKFDFDTVKIMYSEVIASCGCPNN